MSLNRAPYDQVIENLLNQVDDLKSQLQPAENKSTPHEQKGAVKGEVQKAFGKDAGPPMEELFEMMNENSTFMTHFGKLLEGMNE